MVIKMNGFAYFRERLVVEENNKIKEQILQTHRSKYTMHPGSTRMYQALKQKFWWHSMKGEIAKFVSRSMFSMPTSES